MSIDIGEGEKKSGIYVYPMYIMYGSVCNISVYISGE